MPVFSVVVLAALLVLFQIAIVDEFVVPELSKVFKNVEQNGTAIDDALKDVTNRLDSFESLFNVTIR